METTVTTARGTVTIRPARQEDAPAYRDLRLEALHNHPEAFSSDYAANVDKPLNFWEENLRPDRGDRMVMLYFAVHEQQLIGMCGIVQTNSPKTRHTTDIFGMYVRPDWRGFRLAERLLTECISWARLQEAKIVRLTVVTTNTAAIRCYDRCGFRVYGVEPQALYHDGVYYDELLMVRSI